MQIARYPSSPVRECDRDPADPEEPDKVVFGDLPKPGIREHSKLSSPRDRLEELRDSFDDDCTRTPTPAIKHSTTRFRGSVGVRAEMKPPRDGVGRPGSIENPSTYIGTLRSEVPGTFCRGGRSASRGPPISNLSNKHLLVNHPRTGRSVSVFTQHLDCRIFIGSIVVLDDLLDRRIGHLRAVRTPQTRLVRRGRLHAVFE